MFSFSICMSIRTFRRDEILAVMCMIQQGRCRRIDLRFSASGGSNFETCIIAALPTLSKNLREVHRNFLY